MLQTTSKKSGALEISIIVITLGAAFVRIIPLATTSSLSFDEAWSVWIAQKSLPAALEIITYDKHPPLFYMALYAWTRLVGTDELALRLLSALVGILCVMVLYRVGYDMFDARTGAIAALLMAVSPFQVFYAQEARMYPLAQAFSLFSMAFFWRATRRNRLRDWAGYVLATLLALFTHYIAGLVLIGQAAFLLFDALRNRKQVLVLRFWLVTVLAIALVGLFWLPKLIVQVRIDSGPPPWIASVLGTPGPKTLFMMLLRDFAIFGTNYPHWFRLLTYFVNVALVLLAILELERLPSLRVSMRNGTICCLVCLILPIGSVWLISQVWPMFVARYLIPFSGLLYLLLAWGTRRVPMSWARSLIVILLVVAWAWGSVQLANQQRERDWKIVVNYIVAHWKEGDVVVITPPANWIVFEYYAQSRVPRDLDFYRRLYPSYPAPPDEAALSASLLDRSLTYRRLWWIDEQGTGLAAEWTADPQNTVLGFLDQHFYREDVPSSLSSQWGDVFLYRLEAQGSEAVPPTPRASSAAVLGTGFAVATPLPSSARADVYVDWAATTAPSPFDLIDPWVKVTGPDEPWIETRSRGEYAIRVVSLPPLRQFRWMAEGLTVVEQTPW